MENESTIRTLRHEVREQQRRIDELNTLLSSVELINSSFQLFTILDDLMERACAITGAEAASALLIENDRLCFVAASGTKSVGIKKTFLDRGEGVAGWVADNGRPLIIEDAGADPRFAGRVDAGSGFVTRSILAVPLKIEGEVIGVVEALNKKGGASFTESDVRLLSSLGSSAAIAVHKARLYGDVRELFFATIHSLANAIEAKDCYTRGHCDRIARFSEATARELGIAGPALDEIRTAALLHDVGKIGVPEAVLGKKGRLTDEEFAEIKRHPDIGADMLASIRQLKEIIPAIRHHEERYDGRGYPAGLKGGDIPLPARIIAVTDTFDAMTSDRPYRAALPDSVALEELKKFSGIQFDPACVDAFFKSYAQGRIQSFYSQRQSAGNAAAGQAQPPLM